MRTCSVGNKKLSNLVFRIEKQHLVNIYAVAYLASESYFFNCDSIFQTPTVDGARLVIALKNIQQKMP